MINTFISVNYSYKYALFLSQPKSWVKWAIIDLHDYISYFLINVLIVVFVYSAYCLLKQQKSHNNLYYDYSGRIVKVYDYYVKNIIFIKKYTMFKLEDFCHAPRIEFFWTIVPLIMLAFMGWPSFKTLYSVEQLVDPLHTVIVVGNQWYWSYAYNDFDVVSDIVLELDSKENLEEIKRKGVKKVLDGTDIVLAIEILRSFDKKAFFQFLSKNLRGYEESKIAYDCVIMAEEDLPLGYPRLLSTDQVLVLPSHAAIRLIITSSDVIHSWALPSHGIKMDAVPGRINQINFLTSFWGTYWGQCSELCGINHGFMPIEVRVIPLNDYFDYLRLNVSYRLDKLVPIVEILFHFYFIYLKHKAFEKRFCSVFEYYMSEDI